MPNSCWTTANSLPHCRFHVLIDPRCLSHSASLRLFLLAALGEWFISTAGNAGLSRPMISRWSGGPSVNPCWRLGSITNTMSCFYPENLFETKGLHVEDHILTWSLQSSSTLSSAMDPVSCLSAALLLPDDPGNPFSLLGVVTVIVLLDPPGLFWLEVPPDVPEGDGPVGVGADPAGVEAPPPPPPPPPPPFVPPTDEYEFVSIAPKIFS